MSAKSYYFTANSVATDKEAKEAAKLGYVLVNGAFGSTFNRECKFVAGNVPEHLKDKIKPPATAPKAAPKKVAATAESDK